MNLFDCVVRARCQCKFVFQKRKTNSEFEEMNLIRKLEFTSTYIFFIFRTNSPFAKTGCACKILQWNDSMTFGQIIIIIRRRYACGQYRSIISLFVAFSLLFLHEFTRRRCTGNGMEMQNSFFHRCREEKNTGFAITLHFMAWQLQY